MTVPITPGNPQPPQPPPVQVKRMSTTAIVLVVAIPIALFIATCAGLLFWAALGGPDLGVLNR